MLYKFACGVLLRQTPWYFYTFPPPPFFSENHKGMNSFVCGAQSVFFPNAFTSLILCKEYNFQASFFVNFHSQQQTALIHFILHCFTLLSYLSSSLVGPLFSSNHHPVRSCDLYTSPKQFFATWLRFRYFKNYYIEYTWYMANQSISKGD